MVADRGLERAGVHADADRDAGFTGGVDDRIHAIHVADVAGVDAQRGGADARGFDGESVVEVDVGHNGDR